MGVFFISWQLWEEMTFVLACAIVVVFLIGIFKLWRTSRQVCRQEAIDEEERARLSEMRKVGLSPPRTRKQRGNSDIPFGVRAIQTGVEVDGIWISQPTTPSEGSSAASKTRSLAGSPAGNPAESRRLLSDYQPYASSPLGHSNTVAEEPDASSSETPPSALLIDTHSNTSREHAVLTRTSSSLDEDALRRLEGIYAPTGLGALGDGSNSSVVLRPPLINTYIPSSRVSSPSPSVRQERPHHDLSTPGGAKTGPDSNSASSHDSSTSRQAPSQTNMPTTSAAYASYRGYHTQPIPSRVPQHFTAPPPSTSASSPHVSVPAGSAFVNRTARRVNSSFEVLPAGTFAAEKNKVQTAAQTASSNGSNADDEADALPQATEAAPSKSMPRGRNKLRRATNPVR